MIGIIIGVWNDLFGSPAAPPPATNHILLETGDGLLAEDGTFLTLE